MTRESFEPSLTCVLRHEGGYSDHPSDPGGATMMGITLATLAEWRGQAVTKADVRALGREEAAAIYRARYWNSVRGDDLPAGLDLAVFDFAVNSGPLRAIRTLQHVLGTTVDGRIGAQTLAAAHTKSLSEILAALCAARLGFLEHLQTFPVFGRGWTRRVRNVEMVALRLAASSPAMPAWPSPPLPQPAKETSRMDITKTIFASRTIWANGVGMIALACSWLGFDTSSVDKTAVTDHLLLVITGVSFVASTVFRVLATKRLI